MFIRHIRVVPKDQHFANICESFLNKHSYRLKCSIFKIVGTIFLSELLKEKKQYLGWKSGTKYLFNLLQLQSILWLLRLSTSQYSVQVLLPPQPILQWGHVGKKILVTRQAVKNAIYSHALYWNHQTLCDPLNTFFYLSV